MTYTIKIPQFEGPFDLLLFFIERDELDINDIPIAKITDDFLAYIRHIESLNIDVASEFIVVAATLMRIKAKMLLPRMEVDEEGNEIDPRQELVQRLMEYKAYKSVLEEFRTLEENQSKKIRRGFSKTELNKIGEFALEDAELESLSLFKLMRAFERVLERFEDEKKRKTIHRIVQIEYEVEDEEKVLEKLLEQGEKKSFEGVFGECQNRIHAVVRFLAILELLNRQIISLIQGEGVNNFWLARAEN